MTDRTPNPKITIAYSQRLGTNLTIKRIIAIGAMSLMSSVIGPDFLIYAYLGFPVDTQDILTTVSSWYFFISIHAELMPFWAGTCL